MRPAPNNQHGEDEDEDEDEEGSTSGMSRASSDEPTSNKVLVVPPDFRRRNSISVLPSIELKPKFPGSCGGEGKRTDPDLVLWIANKLKTKLKLTRISKAYDRYFPLPLFLLLNSINIFNYCFPLLLYLYVCRFIPSNFYSEMGKQDIREVCH